MSLYDEIINGTYKKGVTKINYKKKEDEDDYNSFNNLYDSIKNGTDYSVNNINTNVSSGIPDMSNNKLYKSIIDGTFGEQYAKSKNANKNVETKIEEKEPASFGKKAGWVAKKTGAGIAGGVTGIGQAAITDIANNIQQGKEKGIEGIKEDLKGTDKIQKERNELVKDSLDTTVKVSQIMNDKNTSKVEKVFNLFMYGIGQVMNKIGKAREDSAGGKLINAPVQALGTVLPESTTEDLMNINQNISKPIEEMNQRLAEEGQNYGIATQWIGNAMQSVGNMTPSIAATLITKNPNIGLGIMGVSAKGQSTEEALKKGSSLNEAVKIGDEKGMIEIGTEMLTGGVNIFGKGALDDILQKGIVDKVKNNVAKFFVQQGVNVLGETLEETISDIVDTAIDKGTIDPNATYSLKDWTNTAIETTLSTFVLNLITGGMVNDVRNIKNNGTELKTVIDAEETKPLFVTKTTPDGNISFVESTQGIPIENSNNDLNINPAIVYNNKTDTYNVIDSNTGLLLDNSPYPSILSAKIGFNEKTTNISEAQVKKINDSVVKTELALIQKTNEIITELEENEKTNRYNNINIENNINNQQNTPTQINQDNAESNFYNEKTNYAVSNIEDIETTFNKKKSYTLKEVEDVWENVAEDTYDIIQDDDYQVWLQENKDGQLEAVLYDSNEENDFDNIVNSVIIEPTKNGRYTSKAINNAIKEVSTILDENRPIQGQIDIEGNQVVEGDDINGKRERQIRNGNNEKSLEGNKKRENTRRKEENGRNNENSKREISRGLSNYVEQKKERLGKDFKAEIVKESDITEREKIVSKGFKDVTGLDDIFYNTNKSTTESAFYSVNEIYQKHKLFVTKKALNHAPYHEFGHWLKDNMPIQWNKLHKIMDKTITKEQIEDYISVLNDREYYNKMKTKQKKETVINEIISDYFGNWANDISNLKPLLEQGIISQEYAELIADITKEEKVVGYEVFGTLEQEQQINETITDIMRDIVENRVTSGQISKQDNNDIPLFEDRGDTDDYFDSKRGIWYNKNGIDINIKEELSKAIDEDTPKLHKGLHGKFYRSAFFVIDKLGHNTYKPIMQVKIEGNEDFIDSIRKELKNGTFKRPKAIDTIIQSIRDGRRFDNTINDSDTREKENRTSDTIYTRGNGQGKEIEQRQSGKESNGDRNNKLKNSKQGSFIIPKNVKDIKNLNQFIKQAAEQETDKYWKNQLEEAKAANYVDWTRKESRLKWKRRIVQQYLDYKNGIEYSDRNDIDSNGNQLSKKQQEFFKNSKAVDKDGTLKVVYHGTGEGTFNIFNGGTRGANYYTDNIWSAKSYQVGTSTANKVYEGYVNIEKPLIIDVENRNWSEIWRDSITDKDVLKAIDDDFKNKYETYSTTDIVIAAKATNKYDGIIFNNIYDNSNNNKNEISTVYVTFNSNQFKNIDNKNPTSDPDIRYSDRYDTDENGDYGFYSQLEKVIEEKMPNTSNAQQINGILNNAGIKQDEMKWIGLDDYLKAHSLEKLSKEKVMEYIKANQIYIETVQKGDNLLRQYTEPIKSDIKNTKEQIKNYLEKYHIDYEETEGDIWHYQPNGLASGTIGDFMAEELEKIVDLNDSEKFEKMEDESYLTKYELNDVKWTSHFTEKDFKRDMKELADLYEGLHEAQMNLSMIQDEYGDDADEIGIPRYKEYKLQGGTNYQEKLYTLPEYYAAAKYDSNKHDIVDMSKNIPLKDIESYTSPHWKEKNVLAHTRTQDFEDINGNKVLFIDEIQSDLHQKGRKEGYRTKEQTEKIHDIERKIKELQDKHNDLEEKYYDVYHDIRDRMVDEMNKIQNKIIKDDDIFKKIESILSREEQQRYSTYLIDISYLLESQYSSKNFDVTDRKQLEKDIKNVMDTQTTFPNLPDSIVNKFENKNQFNKYTYDFIQSSLINDIREDYKVGIHVLTENELNKFATERERQIIDNRRKVREDFNKNFDILNTQLNELKYGENVGKISDVFPFKKNWHEFALRRIINDAVSQGYDEVAWTTGRQQRERYNLSKAIDYIEYQRFYDHPNDVDKGKVGEVEISAYKDGNNVFDRQIRAENLADYIGKDLAMRILNAKEGKGTISNLDEEIRENGNSGMYLFYDQEIPSYLNKYLKKWNSKVEPIVIKDIDGKDESVQPGFKITKEMRESIKQNGQPLFSDRADIDDESKTPKREYTKEEKEYLEKQRKERLEVANQIRMNKQNADERANSYIEKEIKKIEATGDWDNSIPVTKMSDIRRTIEDYLGIGVQRGHFKQMAYGIYKADRDVLRTKNLKDMDNILHETGHALDLGKRLNIDKGKIASELLLAVERHGGYENESKQVKLDEGFAEILREYAIVPKEAKADYPQTVAVIEGIRNENKSFDKFINKVQQQIYNYIHQNPKNRVLSNISIGEQTDKPKWSKEWIKEEVMRNVYDKDYSLKLATNKLGKTRASENAYYLTRLASGIGDKITGMLSDGYVDDSGNKLFPGLNSIGEILGNDPKRFNDLRAYLVARRDSDYKAKTLKTGIRTMDSQAVIEQFKNDKQIQEAAQLVYDTLDGVLQYAVNNHLLTQENADKLRESNTFYVPMQRVLGLEGNNVGRKGAVANIIKQRTGSELDVKDVLENIVANSANVIQQVENNNILKALYKQGESIGLTGHVYDVIPAPMTKVGTATLSMWENELKNQGVNTNELDLEKTVDIFAPDNKIDTKNLITSFINDNGKRVYLQFNDDLIFNSLMNIDKKFMSQVLEINRKLNMPLRYGATMANLGFAIPNMISDTAQAAIYSTAGFVPFIDNAIGVLDILASTNKYAKEFINKVAPNYAKKINLLYSLYQQIGATSATRLSQYRETTQNLMKDIYGTKNSQTLGIEEKYKPLKRLLDFLTYIPEISEQSTRFRVFEKNYSYYLRDTGSETDARIMAALESRDATQDFGRTGNLTREINQLIPFSAARVGSIYTFSEKIKSNPKKVAMRIAILTALAMTIKAIGYDDDEIDELIQRKKDDNFVIKIGKSIYTIKKPQGILRSLINFTEYIQDLFTGHIEDGHEAERLSTLLQNSIMDNMPSDSVTGLVPNMVVPLIENAINKDLYYKTDIVKSYDLELPDAEQYYDYNSQLAILLGRIFNYSPAKIDNLISGYFAGLGTTTTNIMDSISGKVGLTVEKPEMGAEQNTVGKRFVVNVNSNSASLDEIYNKKTELTKKKNGGTITAEETQELDALTDAISNISKVNKQIKEIKKSLEINGKEKAEQIKVLQQQRTDIARQALGKNILYDENEGKNASIQFYTTSNTLKKNGYSLEMTADMKKEYEQIAYEYYSKYEKQGLYSEEKLKELKSKAKDYAKSQLFKTYKDQLVKSK